RQLGERLTGVGQPLDAAVVYRQAIGEQQRLALRFPREASYRRELAGLYHLLGQALWAGGDLRGAERALDQDAELFQALAAESPTDLSLGEGRGHSLRWRAWLVQASRPDQAEQLYRQALGLFEELMHRAPEQGQHRYLVADTHRCLAELCRNTHRPRQA